MEYMFLIYTDEARAQAATEEENAERRNRGWAILDDAKAKGVFRGAAPLQPVATAVTVRSSGGSVSMVDGPFAETKEVLGGYWIIDCRSLEEAKEWGARLSQTGCAHAVEIRPLRPIPAREPAHEQVTLVNA